MSMHSIPKTCRGAVAAATAAVLCAPLHAQSDLLEEVVVTAQKREQNAQDVGIAITAYSGEQLRLLNVSDSTDLAAFSPGVFTGGAIAGQNTQFTIRGVTQNDFNDVVEAPNAVYLDEGYIAIGQGQTFALFDIDRVEVLKGPQGTLFGRNATGGLVHYVSTKPSLAGVSGYLDTSYGLYDSTGTPGAVHAEGALNLPVTATIATRFAFTWNQHDPLLRNQYPLGAVGGAPGPGAGANLGNDNTWAARWTTLFEPNDATKVLVALNGSQSRLTSAPYLSVPTIAHYNSAGQVVNVTLATAGETRASIGPDGQDFGSDVSNSGQPGAPYGRPVPGGDYFGWQDPGRTRFVTSSDFAFNNSNHIRTYGADVDAEFKLSDATTLTSVTDYKDFYKLLFLDVDSGPGNQLANYQGVDAYSLTQELRLAGKTAAFDWVTGLYYLHISDHSINGLKIPTGSVVPGAPFDLGGDAALRTNSYSGFGQIDWHFAPHLTLIAGGRLIREEKDYRFVQGIWGTQGSLVAQQGPVIPIGPVIGPNGPEPFTASTGSTLWAGKLQLNYQPTNELLWYTGINRGVKAGSFNAQLPGGLPTPASAIPYKPEVLLSYESGAKYTFNDGRSRLNASAFYYDYSNYQAFLFSGVSGVVINAPDKTYGAEADFFTSPVKGLDAGLTVSWFDATVKNVPLRVDGTITRDVHPTYAPPLQVTAVLRYEWPAWRGRLSVSGDAEYVAPFYYNLRNFSADQYASSTTLNSALGWGNDAWSLAFKVRNITDVRAGNQGFDLASLCGCNEVSYKPPRFFQLDARYSF
jgi:iron complex outermembrane receptor protein